MGRLEHLSAAIEQEAEFVLNMAKVYVQVSLVYLKLRHRTALQSLFSWICIMLVGVEHTHLLFNKELA